MGSIRPLSNGRGRACRWNSCRPTRRGPCTLPTGPCGIRCDVSNLLEAVGYDVEREYYINDAAANGYLALSAWLRYLERCAEHFAFPSNAYVGEIPGCRGRRIVRELVGPLSGMLLRTCSRTAAR